MDIDEAATYSFSLLDDTDIDLLDADVQTFIRVYSAQGIIDNGGFQYFFENDFPGRPPYSVFVDAYTAIGCDDVAEWMGDVILLLGGGSIHKDVKRRGKMLRSLKSKIDPISDLICGNDDVWQKLSIFVNTKSNKFGVA